MNTSHNNSFNIEFPLWKPLIFTDLFLFVGVLAPVTLFMNISVFVALLRSQINHRPLLVLYGSLLIGLCVDKLLICVDQIVNSPVVLRYCECMNTTLILLSLPRFFFLVYSIVVVTCQSVLQLLVMKGRQKWQKSFKRNICCVLFSSLVAGFWMVLFGTGNFLSEYPLHCESFCSNTPENSAFVSTIDASLYVILSFIAFTLLPCIAITLMTSSWAFFVFKKKFIVRDEKKDIRFSRRILFLPIFMTFLLFFNSILSYVVTIVTGEILHKGELEFYGNWANFMSDIEYFVLDLLHGVSYSLLLLYLYSQVRVTWRKMLSYNKNSSESNIEESVRKSYLSASPVELTPSNSSEQ